MGRICYVRPMIRVVELSVQTLLAGSNEPPQQPETVDFTFTTTTPSGWTDGRNINME